VSDPSQVSNDLVSAIHHGDIPRIRQLTTDNPGLASRPLGGQYGSRTPLHAVADWPGYFPNGPEVVRILVAAGADPNERQPGEETPLHWAASSDDVHVAAALIDAGADLNTPDGSIGTPLGNAVGYACWDVARLLVARGAEVTQPWHASAVGLLERLDQLLGAEPPADEVSKAFWHACSGGQRRAAEYLLGRGADPNWIPEYARGTPLDAAGGFGTQRENLIVWLRQHGARPADADVEGDGQSSERA
jgi:ankyrin repeat protein